MSNVCRTSAFALHDKLFVMAMPRSSHPAYWAPYALVGDGGR